MRIAFVTPYFYPAFEYGGTPRVAYDFARGLVRRGHQVTVFTTDSGGRKRIAGPHKQCVDGIQVFYYSNLSNALAYNQRVFVPLRFFSDIGRHLSSFDVIHIHEFRNFVTVGAHSALRQGNIRYVLSPHGGLQRLGKDFLKKLFDRFWGKRILAEAAAICAVSSLELEDAKHFGVPEEKLILLPNPIDDAHYATLPARGAFSRKWNLDGKRIVLFLGRLIWIKGIDVLLDAFRLLDNIANLHLAIAGADDGAESALRARGAGNVTFTGFLNDVEKLQALVDSEIVVVPSRREGFPGTALEALAAAKPVVLSSMCGTIPPIPELAATGIFESENAQDLARQLRQFLECPLNPGLLLEARSVVLQNFSTDALARKAEDLYRSIIT